MEKNTSKLKKVLKENYKLLKNIPGVKEVGYGFKYKNGKRTATQAIIVSVGKKAKLQELPEEDRIPKSIDGVPVDVIEMYSYEQDYRDPYAVCDDLCGGLSISIEKFTGSGGTMGAIVYENRTERLMGLTNHHVLFHSKLLKKTKAGDRIIQPAFKRVSSKTIIGELARGDKHYDCAVFYLKNTRTVNMTDCLNGFTGKINGVTDPEPGMKVKKTGARTQMTFGIIDHVYPDYFIVVSNPDKPAPKNEISYKGDSGAVWVTDDAENIAVGLHNRGERSSSADIEWAGAIKMSKVVKKMNIHF